MDISQISNADFTEDTEPRDDRLMELLTQAYKGEILCTMAIANIEVIQPFSAFKPTISKEYRTYFTKKAQGGLPPALHVYAKDGKLIMSDDYGSFSLYQELKMPQAVCIVIGETPDIVGIEYTGEQFRLPLPTAEEI